MTDDLLQQARDWAADDPDPVTKAELEALIESGESDDLADRFDGTLEFGTAGLRGALGAGPNRMNRVVVLRAAAGLAAYLRANGAGPDDSVVIGYDARHNSDVFARDTAEVMTGAGLKAFTLPRPLPTPLLAFAIRDLGSRRRGDGHREPQPAAGQRLQGLPRRRQPDRAARRRGDRGADCVHRCSRGHPARRRRRGPRRRDPRPLPEDRGASRRWWAARPEHRLHTAARRRRIHRRHGAEAGRLRGAARRHRAGGARPRLPDGRLPQPRGAGGDGPGHGPRRARWTPTSSWPTTPTPIAARSRSPVDRTAGRCCAATRSVHSSHSTCSSSAARASTRPRSCRRRCWARWRSPRSSCTPRR